MAFTSPVQRHNSRGMQPYRRFSPIGHRSGPVGNPVAALVAAPWLPWALGLGAGVGVLAANHYLLKGHAVWLSRQLSEITGKPILSIGARCENFGDVRCDLEPTCEGVIYCDAEDLSMFTDKQFGVAYMSHVLEHVQDPEEAVRQASRVADNVVAVIPSAVNPGAWLMPAHRWMWVGENPIALGSWRYGIAAGAVLIGLLWWSGRKHA